MVCFYYDSRIPENEKSNHIKYLKDLHTKITFKWYQSKEICVTSYDACYSGHIDCLKYLHEKVKIQLEDSAVFASCDNNHLDCLYYCLENNCPLHNDTLFYLNRCVLRNESRPNTLLRKVLLHPIIQNEISKNKEYNKAYYPTMLKMIDEYKKIIQCINILLNETNIPQDVIKYEIMKYI